MRTLAGFVLCFSVVQAVIFLMATYHLLFVAGWIAFAGLCVGGLAWHFYKDGWPVVEDK